MELDQNNKEFNLAVNFLQNSNKNIYLTGKAGTGKTTFLKYIKNNIDKRIGILAPTGIAAINAGGVTIHSFFQIGKGVFPPGGKKTRMKAEQTDADKSTIFDHFKYNNEKREILNKLELLIIDEVSMVSCDMLDLIDKLLRVFGGRNRAYPFGGIQVVLIGDAFQLPPVMKEKEWNILKEFYESKFFFHSKVFQEAKFIRIELKKIYRQSDIHFIDILNKIRINQISKEDIFEINKRVNWNGDLFENEIMLCTHRTPVEEINQRKLNDINKPNYTFIGLVTGKFREKEMPTNMKLKLKENAQIIFVKNDSGEDRKFYNGKIGKVIELEENEIKIEFKNKEQITIQKHTWEKIEYEWDKKNEKIKGKLIGTFTQFPIKLAWAITVHKSQGLTFDNAVLDLNNAFAPGQVYVALSRCTSLEGIRLKSPIQRAKIMTDKSVIEFDKNMEY